jgi:putative ABC transport system permease protein
MSEILDLAKSAFADFKRSKTRSFLTALGITIGVFSVVLLIALGLGLKNYIQQQFESLGANLIMVFPGSGFGGQGFGQGLIGGTKFDERDYASLKRVQNVDLISPLFMKTTVAEADGNKASVTLMGLDIDAYKLMNVEPLAGELLKRSDIDSRSKKVVIGQALAEELFEKAEKGPGSTLTIEKQRYKVVGVAKKTGDREADNGVFMSYKTTFTSLNPEKTFFALYLGTKEKENVEAVKKGVETALLRRYDEDDFTVSEQSELLGTFNQIFTVINSILIAIASISLIVGGIGIMNIMYATVTERTKEIGIRRAVGATERDILIQFLSESVILATLGGLLGLALAAGVVLIIRIFFPASINLLSVIVSLGISSVIGIFFGVFPARRAAKLPPNEAIRYE